MAEPARAGTVSEQRAPALSASVTALEMACLAACLPPVHTRPPRLPGCSVCCGQNDLPGPWLSPDSPMLTTFKQVGEVSTCGSSLPWSGSRLWHQLAVRLGQFLHFLIYKMGENYKTYLIGLLVRIR